jgi:hypothetical protein
MTKILLAGLALVFAGISCVTPQGVLPGEVTFVWFNLSTNEIWVTDALGLPDQSWPGRLMPVHREDQLSEKSATIMEDVRIRDRITIKWKDNGKQGFSGFARSRSSDDNPPGVAHQAEFKRDELGLPAKTGNAKIRFTYLGNDKWSITRLK